MAEGDDFQRRLLLSVDVQGYGARTDRGQGAVQEGLLKVLDDAGERAGLNRSSWLRQQQGDGELAVLPASEPEPRVVDDFVRQLAASLRRHNRTLRDDQWLRLRVALHFGTAIPSVNGIRGAGPVHVSRLCDSAQLKAALVASGELLAVALSDHVYADVIRQEHTSLDAGDFRRVRVQAKELDADAWLWIPNGDVHALDLPTPPVAAATADVSGAPADNDRNGEAAQRINVNIFHERVNAKGAVFGFQE